MMIIHRNEILRKHVLIKHLQFHSVLKEFYIFLRATAESGSGSVHFYFTFSFEYVSAEGIIECDQCGSESDCSAV